MEMTYREYKEHNKATRGMYTIDEYNEARKIESEMMSKMNAEQFGEYVDLASAFVYAKADGNNEMKAYWELAALVHQYGMNVWQAMIVY